MYSEEYNETQTKLDRQAVRVQQLTHQRVRANIIDTGNKGTLLISSFCCQSRVVTVLW